MIVKKPIIDIVGGTGRIGLTVPFTYRYRHTPRTNGAARARRLVDRDAINEINLPVRWHDRLRRRDRNRAGRLFSVIRDGGFVVAAIIASVAKSITGRSTEIALCRA